MRCAEEEVELVGHQHEVEQLSAEPADRQSQSIDEALVALSSWKIRWRALPLHMTWSWEIRWRALPSHMT